MIRGRGYQVKLAFYRRAQLELLNILEGPGRASLYVGIERIDSTSLTTSDFFLRSSSRDIRKFTNWNLCPRAQKKILYK